MALPRRLIIESTSRCNLRCQMCLREVLKEPTGDLEMETYARLLPLFPHLESVNLTGYGEPLLHDRLLEMVRLAKAHLPPQGWVSFITNGSLLTPELAQEIVKSGLDELGVSIEGCSAPTHDEIRTGSDFCQVLDRAALVVQARQSAYGGGRPHPQLVIHFVAMKRNLGELPALVRLARELGADRVVVSHLLPHTKDLKDEAIYSHHSAEALAYFQDIRAAAKAEKLDLSLTLDFVPYVYTLAGLPPLRNIMPPDASWLQHLPPSSRRLMEVVARVMGQAAADKVALSSAKLVRGEGMAREGAEAAFARAQKEAEGRGIGLTLPPLHPKARRECGFIQNSTAFISWDGYMRPCQNLAHAYPCYLNGRLKYITPVSFGNVREQEPQEIWGSPAYRNFRATTERFDFPPCGDCGFADGCSLIRVPVFDKDCYFQTQPCGDCPWSRGLLQC